MRGETTRGIERIRVSPDWRQQTAVRGSDSGLPGINPAALSLLVHRSAINLSSRPVHRYLVLLAARLRAFRDRSWNERARITLAQADAQIPSHYDSDPR